jgi:uncharacterized protein (TIRG00374 family)
LSPTARPKRIWKGRNLVLWTVLSAVIIFILLALISDLKVLQGALEDFPVALLFPIALLSLGNYFLRYIKWHWYLKIIGHRIPPYPNLLVFLSGFALTVTPGKVGEFIKTFIVKERFRIPYTASTAVLLMERFTDVAALLVLTCIGITLEFLHWSIAVFILAAFVGFLIVVRNRTFVGYMINLTGRIKPLRGFSGHLSTLYEEGMALLKLRVFSAALALSVIAWLFEGIGYALVARGFGFGLSIPESAFIYSAALLGGVITLFFGGLGATEGGMVGLGMAFGMSPSIAAASTIIIRVMTLWFAVAIGWIVFLATPGFRSLLKMAREESPESRIQSPEGEGSDS